MLERGSLPLLELFPVSSVALFSRAGGDVCSFNLCPDSAEEAWLWLWAGMGLRTRFPSLPALISLSPIRNMHERLPCSSFLKLGLLDPPDLGLPRWEDLDIFPAGLSQALVRYSRVPLVVLAFTFFFLGVFLLLLSLLFLACLSSISYLLFSFTCEESRRWNYFVCRFPTVLFLLVFGTQSFCLCSCLLPFLVSGRSSEMFR